MSTLRHFVSAHPLGRAALKVLGVALVAAMMLAGVLAALSLPAPAHAQTTLPFSHAITAPSTAGLAARHEAMELSR